MLIELLLSSSLWAKELCVGDCDANGNPIPRSERMEKLDAEVKASQSMPKEPIDFRNRQNTSKTRPNNDEKPRKKGTFYTEKDTESNLPGYFTDLPANADHGFVFSAKEPANDVLFGVNAGSKIKVVIRQNIKASPNVPTPVVGEIISGQFKGSTVFGEATLESDLKRVLIKFTGLSGGGLISSYSIQGRGLDPQGRIGVEGNYHAEDWKYGIASFLSTGAAIAVDSQVERNQTITGGYAESPSVANAVKKGVAGSLGKVADRMAERAGSVPGYTEVEGPIYMTVVLDTAPKVSR